MTRDEIKKVEQEGSQPGDPVGTFYDERGRSYIERQLPDDAAVGITTLAEPYLTKHERELLLVPLLDTVRDRMVALSNNENSLHYALHWELVTYLACDFAANNVELGALLEAYVRKARIEQYESDRWMK